MHDISRMLTYWPSNTGSLECPVFLSSTFQATKHIIISCLSEAKTHSNTPCVGTSVCHQAISVTTNFPSVLHPDKLNLQLWHFSSSVCLPLPRWKAVEWRQRARGRERDTYKSERELDRWGVLGSVEVEACSFVTPCLLIIYIKLTFGEFTLGSVIVFFRQFCIANRENGILSTLTNF